MISLQCSTCYFQFEADDRSAGHVIACPNCENKIAVPLQASSASSGSARKFNELSILGFILGFVGLLISPCCVGIGLPAGGIGLACSIFGLRAEQKIEGNLGLAIAGIVLGGIDLVLAICWLIWMIATSS